MRMETLRGRIWTVLRHPASLKARAANTGLWTLAGMAVQMPLRLGTNLVMTRLVAPEAFGLMATVTVLHIGLAMISDVGIAQSVTRDPRGAETRFLRVAWVVQILRSLFMAALLLPLGFAVLTLGPALEGTVYADPRLPVLIWGSVLVVLAGGLQSTAILLAGRNMRIARVTLMEIGAQIVSIVVMIALGLAGFGVWALFSGLLAGAFSRLALSHMVLAGPRMAFEWDREQAAEMWHFGKWLIGSSIGGYFLNNADRLVFGMLLDSTSFGLYAIAAIWVQLFTQVLQLASGRIAFPALSQIRNERPADLDRRFTQILLALLAAGVLSWLAGSLGAEILILALYEPAYHAAAAFMAPLALRLVFVGWQPLTILHMVHGNSRISFESHLLGGVCALGLPVAAHHILGIPGTIIAFGLALAITNLLVLLHPKSNLVPARRAWLAVLAAQMVGAVSYALLVGS